MPPIIHDVNWTITKAMLAWKKIMAESASAPAKPTETMKSSVRTSITSRNAFPQTVVVGDRMSLKEVNPVNCPMYIANVSVTTAWVKPKMKPDIIPAIIQSAWFFLLASKKCKMGPVPRISFNTISEVGRMNPKVNATVTAVISPAANASNSPQMIDQNQDCLGSTNCSFDPRTASYFVMCSSW